jgi:hypothetical protein
MILLPLVHSSCPNYKISENQCYWYADSIYSTAHTFFGSTEEVDPVHGHLQGKYKGIIGIPREDITTDLMQEYRRMRQIYYETRESTVDEVC